VKRNLRKKDHRVLNIRFDFKYKFGIFSQESLAQTFFPRKNAQKYRVAFMMIYLALECNWKNDTTTHKLDDIRDEHAPEISHDIMMRTLQIMRKSGLIVYKRNLFWQLSNRFCKILRKFADDLEEYNSYRETEIDRINRRWFSFHLDKAQELIKDDRDSKEYIAKTSNKFLEKARLLERIRKQSADNRKKALEEKKYRAKLSREALEKNAH
jgi:hypothetical protein